LHQAEACKTPNIGRPNKGTKSPKKKNNWKKKRKAGENKTKEKKTKTKEKLISTLSGTTDSVQRMRWAQTDPVEKGRAGDDKSRQEMETDPALNLTQRKTVVRGGGWGRKQQRKTRSRQDHQVNR
jgi:hypothetical protein